MSNHLVKVRHPGLDVTMTTRRSRLPQMDPAWVEVDVDELKGRALDAALEDAGLPKTGSADEKRARLAEYEASPVGADSDPDRDAAAVTSTTNEE